MGVFDTLQGPCPSCGQDGEDGLYIQIKWFSSSYPPGNYFRVYRPGDKFPDEIEDGVFAVGTWHYCCADHRVVYAVVVDNTFWGFVRGETPQQIDAQIKKLNLPPGVEVRHRF